MSAKTITALVNVEDHTDELLSHPVGKFIIDYTHAFDTGDRAAARSYFHSVNAVYVKPDGTSYSGDACYSQILQDYSSFRTVRHEPKTILLYESHEVPGHYEVFGAASVLANLVGDRVPGEPGPVKDRQGDEWDISVPGAFHFFIENNAEAEHDGMFITKAIVYSDSGPVMARLLKRGVMKPADIGL